MRTVATIQYGSVAIVAALILSVVVGVGTASAATTTPSTTMSQLEVLLKRIAELQAQLAASRGEVADILKSDYAEGAQNDDIKKVQELLATDSSLYPGGRVTGFFGPMTRAAIERFQERNGLEVTGRLDEPTRALIKELYRERQNGNFPPGLLQSTEVRERVSDRLADKWKDCDYKLPGRTKFCEKVREYRDDDDEDEDEDDDSAVSTKEVDRDDARKAIADAQRELVQFRSEVRDAKDDKDYTEATITAAHATAEAVVKKLTSARRAFGVGDFQEAYNLAREARSMMKDADENLDDSSKNTPARLLRVCPKEWYVDRMPSVGASNNLPGEYFIYNGVRRELTEFDVTWVKTNCSVKPQAVY